MASTKTAERKSRIMTLRSNPAPRTSTPVRKRQAVRRTNAGPAAVRTAPRKAHKPVLSTPKNPLPGWHDLATGENERHRRRSRHSSFLETISTARFGLLIVAIAVAFTLYVGHVHSTRQVLAEVTTLRQENLRLHLRYNRLKGDFDRATGPSLIYQRAGDLGLEEGIAYGPTIRVAAR
ncbi:MAG TPA: hypothetical protein VF190_14620 [Rhodothermales bacterium]